MPRADANLNPNPNPITVPNPNTSTPRVHASQTKDKAVPKGCATPCHSGALVLFDCIDRHACFNGKELSSQLEFREVGGFL